MVRRNAVRDVLQQHRLAGARRGDDEAALTLADGDHQIEHAGREVVAFSLERNLRLWVERRQVLEEDLFAGAFGRLEIDRFDLDQREIPLTVFGRPNLPGDGVAGMQIELAN